MAAYQRSEAVNSRERGAVQEVAETPPSGEVAHRKELIGLLGMGPNQLCGGASTGDHTQPSLVRGAGSVPLASTALGGRKILESRDVETLTVGRAGRLETTASSLCLQRAQIP